MTERTLHILHLEDDPLDSELVTDTLRNAGLAVCVDRVVALDEFIAGLEHGGYDLVLSDYAVPGTDPLQALRELRRIRPDVPFIFVTGTLGEELAIETLKLGATDYVLKQHLGRLVPAVRRALHELDEQRRRRQAEQALARSAAVLKQAGQMARLGAWDIEFQNLEDLNANTLRWSDEVYHIFGYEPGAVHVDNDLFFWHVHPDDRAVVSQSVAEAIAQRRNYEVEHRIIRPDGAERVVMEHAEITFDERGRPVRMTGAVQDITERKQVEQALRQRAEEVERLLEVVPAAVWVAHDPQCLTITGNRSANEFYEAVVGENVSATTRPEPRRFFTPDGRELAGNELPMQLAASTNQEVRDSELHVQLPSGRRIAMLGQAVPLRNDAGEVRGCIGAFLDITARMQAEEELKAAKASAEQAKALAESANRAKDHFLAVLSHELRTPLTPVLASVSMLQTRAELDDELQESLEIIRRNTEMEARLIDDLLDLTRIARGKVELDRRLVRLDVILKRAVEVCRPDMEARRLNFRADIASEPLLVHGDAGRLQQVFWNLLKNAIKFTPRAGCIGLRCWRAGDQILVEVKDSGIGIEPEALGRIFNAFEQAERTTTRQFGGLGLGLAISRALIEMHGGSIAAKSSGRNRGAAFTVRLPAHAAEQFKTRRPDHDRPGHVSPAAVRQNHRLRILLVEDHGDTAKIIARLLRRAGHEVHAAGDVAGAIAEADRHDFDLLLSDLGLPDRSGLDLLRELRSRDKQFPAIAMTGFGQEEDVERTRAAGFTTHLTKPIDMEQLESAIAAISPGRDAPSCAE